MALHMVSLVALVILTLLDAYLSHGLYDSARYIAGLNGGVCGWIGGLQGLGLVLPWVFLALGTAATVQVLFWGRFRISVAFLILHILHMALVLTCWFWATAIATAHRCCGLSRSCRDLSSSGWYSRLFRCHC